MSSREVDHFDIVLVGGCFTDMLWYVPHVPQTGETLHATKFQLDFGGKAANQCVMAAKLGARVAMVAMVGKDNFGHNTIENFKAYGVNTDYIQMNEHHCTGVTSIAVDDNSQPTFMYKSGANDAVTFDDVKPASAIISRSPVLVCDKAMPLPIVLDVLKLGKELGAQTIFNPSPALEQKLPLECYPNVDVMVVNAEEGQWLTGITVNNVETAKKAVEELHRRRTCKVVLTLGKDGAVCCDDSEGQSMRVSYIKTDYVQTVDTTGAGDSLVGALAYYLACHPSLPFVEIVQRAVTIATITVTTRGVQSSYPKRDQLPAYLFDSKVNKDTTEKTDV